MFMKQRPVAEACLPDRRQELLIKAALLRGPAALSAWDEWAAVTDFDLVDGGSFRLLPLLYRNLRDEGVAHPLMGRLKGIYRRSWYENQMLFHHAAGIVRCLREGDIRVMLLKGVATVLSCYQGEYGIRPMDDCDILIPPGQVGKAFNCLRESGWRPLFRSQRLLTPEIVPYKHAAHFQSPAGCQLDLHWRLFYDCNGLVDDGDFWAHAVPVDFKGVEVSILDPADHLLHVCVHGMRWNPVPSIRWIADAMAVLEAAPSIDWGRIVGQAEKRRLVLPLAEALGYLRELLDAPVPDAVLEQLDGMELTREDCRRYADAVKIDPSKGPVAVLASKYRHFRRTTSGSVSRWNVAGFMKFLQYDWETCLWQMPFRAGFKVLNRLRKNMIWYGRRLVPWGSGSKTATGQGAT
jgi:hypothetical protein